MQADGHLSLYACDCDLMTTLTFGFRRGAPELAAFQSNAEWSVTDRSVAQEAEQVSGSITGCSGKAL